MFPVPNIVHVDGKRTNRRTAVMLREAERIAGANMPVTQGSYNTGVGASAGTHNGGGALDLAVGGLTRRQINRRVRALRTVGFAAWYRSPLPGVWGAHIHAIAIGTKDLASIARSQVGDYKRGRNGLAGHKVDRHRKMMQGHGGTVPYQTWEQYRRKQRRR